jgi:predicted  nucleic acid-binding Zn-ribbon protein
VPSIRCEECGRSIEVAGKPTAVRCADCGALTRFVRKPKDDKGSKQSRPRSGSGKSAAKRETMEDRSPASSRYDLLDSTDPEDDADEDSDSGERRVSGTTVGLLVAGGVGLLAAVAFIVASFWRDPDAKVVNKPDIVARAPEAKAAQPPPVAAPKIAFNPGSRIVLRSGTPSVFITATPREYWSLMEDISAEDSGSLNRVIQTGRAIPVAQETPAIVLEQSSAESRVRIADGPQVDKEGWTATGNLHEVAAEPGLND